MQTPIYFSIYKWKAGEYALEEYSAAGRPIVGFAYEQDLPALVDKGLRLSKQAGCSLHIDLKTSAI